MVALPILGLWHLWAAHRRPRGRLHGAGFVGFAIGGPLADGLTAWIAAPLLCIGVLFGVLLLTGTTLREAPEALRTMFVARDYDDGYDDGYYDDDYAGEDDYYDEEDGGGFEGGAAADGAEDTPDWQSRTPLDNYPLSETDVAPAEPRRRRPSPLAARPQDGQTHRHHRRVGPGGGGPLHAAAA